MLNDIRLLAAAYSCLSVVVVPLAIVLRITTRQPLLPSARAVGNRWIGTDVVIWLLACFVIPSLGTQFAISLDPPPTDAAEQIAHANRLRALSGLVVVPLMLVGFHLWRRSISSEPTHPSTSIVTAVTSGILTWAIATPIVLTVYFLVTYLSLQFGWPIDEHSLKSTRLATRGDVLVFVLGACVVGPCLEELLFRRVLVPWSVRRIERAWIVMVLGGLMVGMLVPLNRQLYAVGFLAVVGAALLILTWLIPRRKRWSLRTIAGLVATSAFFAVAHASVWPTPIPLFLLAIALAWLMRRGRSTLAVTITHGLFNLVSALALIWNS